MTWLFFIFGLLITKQFQESNTLAIVLDYLILRICGSFGTTRGVKTVLIGENKRYETEQIKDNTILLSAMN